MYPEKNMNSRRYEMKEALKQHKYGLIAMVWTAVTATLLFTASGRLFGGTHTFLRGDLYGQYIAFIHQFLNSLFGPEEMDYSFYFSMGMPSMPLYAYVCMSPFNFLYLLISDSNASTAVLVILKLSLAAYTFQYFSKKVLGNNGFSSVIFAVSYALCGYTVTYYMNIMLLDGVYMLPVIFKLAVDLVKRKNYQWLTLAYAYIFAVSFYEGYIIGIFSFVFLLAVMGVEYGREWKKYLSCLMRLAGIVLLAVLMAAVVLVPMVCYLLWDAAPDSTVFQGLAVTLPDIINNLFLGEMQTEDGIFPQVYCGLLVFYLIPCFFMERSMERKKKIIPLVLLCFLLICSLWEPAYLMMHGFDAPDGSGFRFSYFYSFVLVSIGCLVWKKAEAVTKKRIYFWGIAAVISYFCMLVWQKNRLPEERLSSSIMGLEINAVILVVLGLLLLIKKAQKYQKALPIIMALFVSAELILNGVLVSIRVDYYYSEYKVVYENWWKQTKTVTDAIREEDPGIYRIQYLNGILCNQAPLFDYMGIGLFSSVEDVKVRDTLYHLGYYTSPRVVYDYGGTTFTRMIFGEKYIVKALGPDIAYNGERTWEKNPEALALGYMVSEDILKVSLDSDNAMENQNRLIRGMTGQTLELFRPIEGGYSIELENILLGTYIEEGEEWWEAVIENPDNPNGKMIYFINNSSELPVYAYFSMDQSVAVKASPLLYSSVDRGNHYARAYLLAPRCMELGQNERGETVAVLEMNETTANFAYYKNAYFAYYDDTAVTEAYEQLSGHQMEIQERKGSHIEAVVEATEELPVLFLSIPYEEGWEIRVDDIQVEPIAVVNDTFLAILLEPGTHRIEMEYHSFADQIGRILSCLGAGIWLILCFNIWKRKNRHESRKKSHE